MWEFDSLIPNQENRSLNWLRYFRGIAQLVARLVRDEEAVGSNPAAPTKKNQYTFVYWFFFVSARDLNRAAVRSTANKAIVWLCLARGSHRLGMSNRVHAARSSGICNPKSFDLCSKYDILERQSHIWLQNGQKKRGKTETMQEIKKKKRAVALFVIVLICLCGWWAVRQEGFFLDEIYSYCLANSSYAPFLNWYYNGEHSFDGKIGRAHV